MVDVNPSASVIVFPGQGAQVVGMGRDLAEAVPEVGALFARADELLGIGLSRIIFEGPEEALVDTAIQQPALVLVGLALARAIEIKGGRPLECSAAAGLSLGEYGALGMAGALTFEDAIRLVRRRGELMKEASSRVSCGMAVIMRLDEAAVRRACEEAARETGGVVSPCNFNGGGQIVIGGAAEALARAMELCRAAGAKRAMKLPVAGAFHTELMRPAADGLKEALAKTTIRRARVPVYANVSAAPVQEPDEIRDALERQLTSPVRWEQTVLNMKENGLRRFLELGPGQSLSNMIRKINPDAEARAVSSWDDVLAFCAS